MTTDRRYTEDEIAAIFERAASDEEAAQRHRPHGGGLTLAELTAIGTEVGIAPERIAHAAASVDRPRTAPRPTTALGLPVSVARTVDLPGTFSDRDWELLVADLHDAFQTPGTVSQDGSLRQWQTATLHVMVERTEAGHRLRLRALNPVMQGGLLGGLVLTAMGLFFLLLLASKGDFITDLDKTLFVSMFAIVGVGSMGASAFRLPRWRAEHEAQMDEVVARTVSRSERSSAPALEESSPALDLDLGPSEERDPEEPVRVRRGTRS